MSEKTDGFEVSCSICGRLRLAPHRETVEAEGQQHLANVATFFPSEFADHVIEIRGIEVGGSL